MTRYKARFYKKPGGKEFESSGYYKDEDDFNNRNSTYIFIKLTGKAEPAKRVQEDA